MDTRAQILIVDDKYCTLQAMRLLLEEQFDVTATMDEHKALDILSDKDFEVVIVDLVMPSITGLEMLRRMKEMKPLTEVIMVTGYSSVKTARQTLKSGAFDYIEKPFSTEQLHHTVHGAIEHRKKRLIDEQQESRLLERVRSLEREISKLRSNSHHDMIELLSQVIGIQQSYTMQHLKSAEKYVIPVADELRLAEEEKEDLQVAAALHDIGKLAVDESILNKKAPLTETDWMQLRSHPETGAHILATVDGWQGVAEGVRHHHERIDGAGYPAGLKSDNIPLISRIIFVADAFDAMTSDRAYRKAMDNADAISILKQYRGYQFDPEVVDAFINTIR